ncbi:MAG TPA: S41 family peptidase [Actinobacteria bacterium]|nr:S41 family peptidase [Actinomycetota bacterium]
MPRSLKVFYISLAMALVFLLGVYFGGHYYRLSPLISVMPENVRSALFPGNNLLQLAAEVEGILEENFYQPVNRSDLDNGAIQGMVSSLDDPYSTYMSPEDYQDYIEHHQEGAYVGVGILLEPKDGRLIVVQPLENSPADEAGILAGDEVIGIDGELVAGRVDGEAAAMIRGKVGTTVVLTIKRGEEEFDVSLERRELELPIVTEKMLDRDGRKIGYIRLEQFTLDSGAKVRGAMDKLAGEGAEAVILDLRNNGGGLLDEAVNVASVFIEDGTVVSVADRDGNEDVYEARGDADETIPLVVLVNNFSASASEIVAGAIKDDARGLLVGTRTFGKGVVQNLRPLSNGGAIKYTSGVYYTPAGININEVGIEPDVVADDNPDTPEDETLEQAVLILLGRI